MSRLDDELRNAFRREQPSAQFAARVIERAAQRPAPTTGWWRRLAMLLEPPKVRWLAIGVTASLLLAAAGTQYGRLRQVVVDNDDNAKIAGPAKEADNVSVNHSSDETQPGATDPGSRSPAIKATGGYSKNHRLALARLQKRQELRAEAQTAKEKLMLALYIASATLNDAHKAIHDDSPKP